MSDFSIKAFLLEKRDQVQGVHSFWQIRFYLILLLYLGSLICLSHDPFFLKHGAFMFSRQNFLTIFIAYLVGASFCWEKPVFGKCEGANLLLQCMMLVPLSLLVARILVLPPVETPLTSKLDGIYDFVRGNFFDPARFVPRWILQIFQNWKISLFGVLVIISLSLRKLQWRLSAVIALILIPFGIVLGEGGNLNWLVSGFLLLAVGLSLQFCRYDRLIYYENIARKIYDSGCDSLVVKVICRIMTQLETQEFLSENNIVYLVRDEYRKQGEYSEGEYRMMTAEILKQMIYTFNFIEIRNNAQGLVATANPALRRSGNILTGITVIPRIVVLLLLLIGWMLSPIDLIPDAIPLVGALDDIAVALISSVVIKRTGSQLLSSGKDGEI